MKSHSSEHVLPANPRFHLRRQDGLYTPIPFFLVTERMLREIEAERELIMSGIGPALHVKQQKLFARYDPKTSERAFEQMLRMFGGIGR